MRRVLTPELMDQPGVACEDLAEALRFLRLVNRRLGGVRALMRHLERWSARWPREARIDGNAGGVASRPITLLDIATGSADLPIAAVRWARSRGFDLRVTGVDVHNTTLSLAREQVAAACDVSGAITLVKCDALRLMEMFQPGAFDYVHAGLFLHHLPGLEAMTVLRIMDRLARAGIVWNDLARSRAALMVTYLITIGLPRIVRHDATVSVRAGFTRAEAMEMATRVGIWEPKYHLDAIGQRFTVAAEDSEAWA